MSEDSEERIARNDSRVEGLVEFRPMVSSTRKLTSARSRAKVSYNSRAIVFLS